MPKVTYIGPHDAVEVLGQVCENGESIDVPSDAASSLLKQPSNWQAVTTTPAPNKKKED